MQLQPIPSAEHMRLVHSSNGIIDMTYVSQHVQAAALHQLDTFGVNLEQLFGYVIRAVMILKNNRVINHPEEFRLFILGDIDHLMETDLLERHQALSMRMGYVTITAPNLVATVMDTIFKLYMVYNRLFCLMFMELSTTCSALGYPNCDYRLHEILKMSPQEIQISIGCYA